MPERLSRPGVDLLLELSENNAPRRCRNADCDRDADYYVFTDGVTSEYVCEEHLESTVERAQA